MFGAFCDLMLGILSRFREFQRLPRSFAVFRERHTVAKTKRDRVDLFSTSVGALNNSQADLKLIFDNFEQVFDVKLGNYYRTFQEIRIRKSGRTNFLDLMKEKLVERMDEADDLM